MNIAGVVIWYNPSKKDIYNVKSYIKYIDKLYIVDNSNTKTDYSVIDCNKIEYLFQNGNIGVASALNLAAIKAIDDGYNFLLTMDQDSMFNDTDFDKMIKIAKNIDLKNVGIISPWHKTKLKICKPVEKISYPLDVMTSGNLLNLNIYKKIGGFKDFLFIDGVDIEYCLNLKKNGYSIIQLNEIELLHDLGDIFYRKFLWKEFMCDNHNYIRIYYMCRNYRYIRDNYKDIEPQFCNTLVKIKGLIFKIIFYENDKFRKIKSIFLGIRDYRRKKFGKKFR